MSQGKITMKKRKQFEMNIKIPKTYLILQQLIIQIGHTKYRIADRIMEYFTSYIYTQNKYILCPISKKKINTLRKNKQKTNKHMYHIVNNVQNTQN